MKSVFPILVTVLFLAGCAPKADQSDIDMKRRAIVDQMLTNDQASLYLEEEGGKSTRESVRRLLQENKKLSSFRARYNEQKDIPSLVAYADSILSQYQLLDHQQEFIPKGISHYRQAVLEDGDSVSILNLTWYTLYAEYAVLDDYRYRLGSVGDRFWPLFPTMVSDSSVVPGDTVFVFVAGTRGLEKWNVDFKDVACRNDLTGNSISPRIVKTGLHYIFIFVPKEKGRHTLHGPIRITQGKTEEDYPIGNEFVVR